MALASDRLMVAPPLRPVQVVLALGILGLGHEQQ